NKTFIVTNTLDYYPDPTNTPIAGSLRKALTDAGENDHIAFALSALPDVPALIRLQAPLDVTKSVSIDGPGANLLALSGDTEGDGTNDIRIFNVDARLILQGVTVRDGFD